MASTIISAHVSSAVRLFIIPAHISREMPMSKTMHPKGIYVLLSETVKISYFILYTFMVELSALELTLFLFSRILVCS